jgi:hypothetical protein
MATPNLATQNYYSYVDNTSLQKVNYYRLRIVDVNNNFYYSDTISVAGPMKASSCYIQTLQTINYS